MKCEPAVSVCVLGGDTNIKAAGMAGIFSSPAEVTGMSAV
jgi:hypothetical protein